MNRQTVGFTLIELLVAMTLLVVLVTTAMSAFAQMQRTIQRLQAQQRMHHAAKTAYESLSRDAIGAQDTSGIWLRSPGPNQVELIFETAVYRLDTFTTSITNSMFPWSPTEKIWIRWFWDGSPGVATLWTSANNPARYFKVPAANMYKNLAANIDYQNYFFLITPQSRRNANGTLETILNANAWGTGDHYDAGDYDDLKRQAIPRLTSCTDLTCELLLADGSTHAVDGGTNTTAFASSGSFVDGRSPTAVDLASRPLDALDKRPVMVRLRFNLGDPQVPDLRNTYSFSFPLSALGK